MISVVVDFDVTLPSLTNQKGMFMTVSQKTNLLGVLVVFVQDGSSEHVYPNNLPRNST